MRLRGRFSARSHTARRLIALGAGFATTTAVVPAVIAALPGSPSAAPIVTSETTISQGNQRTGWDASEPNMAPAAVQSFVQLFKRRVTGEVYAQPLVAGNTLIVATEKDWVYGFDPVTGAIKWSRQLGTPYTITSCHDLTPDVGITATPVYDSSTGIVYVMAQVRSGTGYVYRLIGLDTDNSGQTVFSRSITGSPVNAPQLRFNARNQLSRPGLLMPGDGAVYAAFGSHCDHTPYVGYVARIDLATKHLVLWSTEAGAATDQAGIWQGGSGLMSDRPGRIFVTSGNGISPAPGTKVPGQLAESVIRLSTASDSLKPVDFFSPDNAPALDAADTDWGSGGPLALPAGTAAYPHVLAQIGKDGRVFLLNRDNLGGRSAKNNNAALSVTPAYHGLWGHPAVFFSDTASPLSTSSTDDYLYFIGNSDKLRALSFGVNGAGKPTLAPAGASALTFGYTSGSPAVTSNGTDINSAVVWAVYDAGRSGQGGMLTAYSAKPTPAGVLTQLKTWQLGTAVSFENVATANGRVYVGSRTTATGSNGYVYAFGAAASAPIAAAPASFGTTPVNTTATRTVTVTARKTVTVTGVAASTQTAGSSSPAATPVPQFSVNAGQVTETTGSSSKPRPVTFPVTLHPGDQLHAPVAFRAAAPGGANGRVSFSTSSAQFPSADVPLAGDGSTPGLYADPAAVSFALVNDSGIPVSNVPAGVSVPRSFNITNGSTRPLTVSSVRLPAGPYVVNGLPRPGTVLQPGQSVPVQVFFAPKTAGTYPGSLSVTAGGSTATAALSGTGLPPQGLFKASPTTLNFGGVKVGTRVTATVTITNTGNEPATVSASTALNGAFRNLATIAPQLPVNAGYDVKVPVAFTPARTGKFATTYKLTWTDVTGSHAVTVRITGTGR